MDKSDNQLPQGILRSTLELGNVCIDRELTVSEAAFVRGISVSAMRKRLACVTAWKEAFFVSGTSKELRTTIRRLRQAEDNLVAHFDRFDSKGNDQDQGYSRST